MRQLRGSDVSSLMFFIFFSIFVLIDSGGAGVDNYTTVRDGHDTKQHAISYFSQFTKFCKGRGGLIFVRRRSGADNSSIIFQVLCGVPCRRIFLIRSPIHLEINVALPVTPVSPFGTSGC